MATAVQRPTVPSKPRRGGRRARYSAQERQQLVQRAMLRLAEGVSFQQSAKELGVSYESLRRWRLAAAGATPIRSVTVSEPAASDAASLPELRLVTAAGHRIEGLDLGALVELVRQLG